MMMIPINKMSCIVLFTLHIGFLSVTEAYYDTVNVKIMNGDEIIELNWKRTGQHVANKNLPIWLAAENKEPRLVPQIMEQMTDFVTYHDVEKSSAVIYIAECNCFYGIIDTRFCIFRLPLNCFDPDLYHKVGDGHVIARGKDDDGRFFHSAQGEWLRKLFGDDEIQFINEIIDRDNSMPHSRPLPVQSCPAQRAYNAISPSAQELGIPSPPTKILYPEVLVFITHDIYHTFTDPYMKGNIDLLVLYYIIYFNAIDMLFAKLATDDTAIRINIAGMVLETELGGFPHSLHRCAVENHHGPLRNFPKYINTHRNIFVEDSFDFFFIATRYQLRENGGILPGKSTPISNVFARKTLKRVDENMLGAIVHQEWAYSDYVVAARQIAQLMNILPDKMRHGSNNRVKQCNSIMQTGGTHCQNCLKWSAENQNQLRNFVRSNLNHCFLLNYPRSLHPYGEPVLSLNPEDQCMCYNYSPNTLNPFYILSIPSDSCDKQIECTYLEYSVVLPLPLDGTPCGSSNKVCWQRKCVDSRQ